MPSSNVFWPTPLVRWPTLFPSQFGVPGTDSDRGLRQDSNGKIIWVDPNHVDANDLRDGTNPDSPMATVAAALTKCRAYAGDVIAVMFNGGWTYSNLTLGRANPIQESVIVTVPGVRIVGIAPSSSLGVPWIPTGDNATCITVRAMDVLIEGFCFWNAGYTGATAISAIWVVTTGITGENLTFRNNYIYHLAYGAQLDYTYNCHIENNRFEEISTQAIHNPSVQGEPDYCTIKNNDFVGCVGAINLPDCDYEVIESNRFMNCTVAVAVASGDNNLIHANTIQGNPAGANNFINLTGGVSNLVSDNFLSCTIAQYDSVCSDAGSGSWVGNKCTNGTTTAPPT